MAFSTVGERTTLTRRRHSWPYLVGRIFPDGGSTAQVIVQSCSGSIITGDRLRQRVSVADGARVRMLGQGAVSVHRCDAAGGALEYLELIAGPGSHLENVAQPRLLHDDSDLVQRTVVRVEQGTVVTLEAVVVIGQRCRYDSMLEIYSDGRLAAREHTHFAAADLPAGMSAFGLLIATGAQVLVDSPPQVWEQWSRAFSSSAAYGVASRLPNAAGLAVRVLARNGSLLREALDDASAAMGK